MSLLASTRGKTALLVRSSGLQQPLTLAASLPSLSRQYAAGPDRRRKTNQVERAIRVKSQEERRSKRQERSGVEEHAGGPFGGSAEGQYERRSQNHFSPRGEYEGRRSEGPRRPRGDFDRTSSQGDRRPQDNSHRKLRPVYNRQHGESDRAFAQGSRGRPHPDSPREQRYQLSIKLGQISLNLRKRFIGPDQALSEAEELFANVPPYVARNVMLFGQRMTLLLQAAKINQALDLYVDVSAEKRGHALWHTMAWSNVSETLFPRPPCR